MPTSHRLACFRDDVVFLVYLYQRWWETTVKHRSRADVWTHIDVTWDVDVLSGSIQWIKPEWTSTACLTMKSPKENPIKTDILTTEQLSIILRSAIGFNNKTILHLSIWAQLCSANQRNVTGFSLLTRLRHAWSVRQRKHLLDLLQL